MTGREDDDRDATPRSDEVEEEGPARRPGMFDRLRNAVRPPAPPEEPPTGTRAIRRAIDRLDPRERRLGFAAAALAVFFGVLIYVSETNNHKFHPQKGQLSPQTQLLLGLAAGALLAITTWLGRRALVGFVALFAFLAFGGSVPGLPFLLLAVWLLYRSYKVQKSANATMRAARGDNQKGSSTPRAARKSSAPSRTATKAGSGKRPTTSEANKRYTPKRPPPGAPKPTRRDQRRARAGD